MKSKHKKGFTLMELLVVIAIISLLLSILLPSLTKVKKLAKRVVCSSRFRQYGLINQVYAQDHREWLPRFLQLDQQDLVFKFGSDIKNVLPYAMTDDLYQYLKDAYDLEAEFLVCPTKKFSAENTSYINDEGELHLHSGQSSADGLWPPYRWTGIARLNGLVNMQAALPEDVEESAIRISDRSDKILGADDNVIWEMNLDHHRSRLAHIGSNGLPSGSNRLFVDGSVKWFSSSVMAADDQPLEPSDEFDNGIDPRKSPPRYDHRGDYTRMYFW